MSKSILPPIDTPKSCRECPLFKSEYNSYTLEHFMMCKVNGKLNIGKDYAAKRHQQCPLQDTTELLEALKEIGLARIWCGSDITVPVNMQKEKAYNKLHKALGGTSDE